MEVGFSSATTPKNHMMAKSGNSMAEARIPPLIAFPSNKILISFSRRNDCKSTAGSNRAGPSRPPQGPPNRRHSPRLKCSAETPEEEPADEEDVDGSSEVDDVVMGKLFEK